MDLQTLWEFRGESQAEIQDKCSNLKIAPSAQAACNNAHALAVITEWDRFKAQDFNEIYQQMEKPAFVFDGRKILNYNELQSIGFTAYEIGKSTQN